MTPFATCSMLGTTKVRKGYIRITQGPHRHKYLHRRAIEELLEDNWNPFWGDRLPAWAHVHHQDGKHDHNCYGNLLVLQDVIHAAVSKAAILRCPYTGRFLTREEYRRMMK